MVAPCTQQFPSGFLAVLQRFLMTHTHLPRPANVLPSPNQSATSIYGSQSVIPDLAAFGIHRPDRVYHNLSAPRLVEEALKRGEGWLSQHGALIVHTGSHTGRSARDKFVVEDLHAGDVWWDSPYQQALSVAHFEVLARDVREYLSYRDVFVLDAVAGADREFALPVRVIGELAWQNLFAKNLLINANNTDSTTNQYNGNQAITVIALPNFKADANRHGARGDTMIALSLAQRLVIIVGTHYAGEIKKAVFTLLNHFLPAQAVMPMHCAANVGAAGDVALFFGMSGTGKTTLSADPERQLIGDDEHGWSDQGVFNIEGGCYAKVIRLSRQQEPEIYATTEHFGTVLENVVFDQAGQLDLDDSSLTENTRAAYPLAQLAQARLPSRAGHPKHVVFLTADAFGVLPAIAKLDQQQALEWFLAGYTAKVAGTERGLAGVQASFETAFGAPFLTRRPEVYAALLAAKLAEHQPQVWLLNTGWTGGTARKEPQLGQDSGPHGVGSRIGLGQTRKLLRAALAGELDGLPYQTLPGFELQVPLAVPGIAAGLLDPRSTWADKASFDATLAQLHSRFVAYGAALQASGQ
jgi:phosphoenolpyruvate carboxykinase (ATP)